MPIDPSIPLGVKSPEFQSPLEIYSTVAQLQAQREQTEARRLAAEEARQKKVEQQQLDQLYASSVTTDPDTGQVSLDFNKMLRDAPGHLKPVLYKQMVADQADMNKLIKSRFDLDESERQWLGARGRDILLADGAPEVFRTMLLQAKQTRAIDAPTYARLNALSTSEEILSVAKAWVQGAGATQKLEKVSEYNAATGQTVDKFVVPTEGATFVQPPKTADLPSYQDVDAIVRFPDGKTFTGAVGFNPKTNTYAPTGSTTAFPPGTTVRRVPPPIDPNLLLTRDMQAQLLRMQLEGGGLTPTGRASEINSLRNSWTKQIQPVLERRASVAKIDAGVEALGRGNRNAATQIIVTAFNKLQDELSVVREGEYLRSEQGQALMARIRGAITRVTEGGSNLTDADLSGLAAEAKNVATELEKVSVSALTDTRQAIEETLDDYKIPHSRVFGSSPIGRQAPAAPAKPFTVLAPNGKTYGFDTAAELAAFKRRTGIQ